MNRKRRALQARIVEEARRHLGYRAQPNRQSAFQLRIYNGQAWNGQFIDRVLHDTFGTSAEVRFVSTTTALSYYINRHGLYLKRYAPGDIVFFNFASDPLAPFEQPHVGVVTEVLKDGLFRTVEGETGPGVPQGSQLVDGVFERVRHATDAIGFVRPTEGHGPTVTVGEPTAIKMSYFKSNPKTAARAVETVQFALNRMRPALTFNRGKKDGVFRSGLGLYARESGYVANRGELDRTVLDHLADESGTFEVSDPT